MYTRTWVGCDVYQSHTLGECVTSVIIAGVGAQYYIMKVGCIVIYVCTLVITLVCPEKEVIVLSFNEGNSEIRFGRVGNVGAGGNLSTVFHLPGVEFRDLRCTASGHVPDLHDETVDVDTLSISVEGGLGSPFCADLE